MNGFRLKENMLIGSASAATQVDGGEIFHSWQDWYEKGKITDGTSPARANDHYNRWREDYAIMKELGLQICRFGVEWARIEPEEETFDEAALAHYREQLETLRTLGIKPLLTLHHFTNPMWFENKGGFEKEENIPAFMNFAQKTVEALGDLVEEYITINEPNVYALNGYFFGEWPPGEKSFSKMVKVMSVMTTCHILCYEMIHRVRREHGFDNTMVGFANHMRVFTPRNASNPVHVALARLSEKIFQKSITIACCTGKCPWPIKKIGTYKKGKYSDFVSVNYYTRSCISGLNSAFFDHVPKNDLGWEIYPEGIVQCAREMYKIMPGPVYITENGTCDNTDSFRCRYLYDHLKALCESELPVARYYHWCFTDNFEWLEGESARFGIVHIDYATQKRTIKKSGRFLAQVIKDSTVTEECYDIYVKNEKYNVL